MKILVDADACPVVRIVEQIARILFRASDLLFLNVLTIDVTDRTACGQRDQREENTQKNRQHFHTPSLTNFQFQFISGFRCRQKERRLTLIFYSGIRIRKQTGSDVPALLPSLHIAPAVKVDHALKHTNKTAAYDPKNAAGRRAAPPISCSIYVMKRLKTAVHQSKQAEPALASTLTDSILTMKTCAVKGICQFDEISVSYMNILWKSVYTFMLTPADYRTHPVRRENRAHA